MDWIPVSEKPKEIGIYFCFVPDCKHYNKHWGKYKWNGHNFIDEQPLLGRGRVVEASHYVHLTEPV